jgi:hypothetical protein
MASVALTLRVLADTSQAASEMGRLGDSTQSFADRAAKAAAVAAGFAAVGAGIMKAAEAASKLEQATGGVEAVFKSSAGAVKQWADQAATSIGLSKSQYMDLATLIGSQLKNAGVAMDELGPSTNRLIQQGADLAAMFGGTTAEAVSSISAALKGERDPIEKYGITLTEAGVQAEILALGLDTSTTAAQQNAKAIATMSLITKQGGDAWGAAAREADTFAAQQQVMKAVLENTMAALGSIFLPMLADLARAFTDMMPAIQAMLTPLANLVAVLLSMPTPILGVVAAFAAWKLLGIGSFVTSMFTTIGTAWSTFARNMQSAKIGSFLSQSGQQMTSFGAAASAAKTQFGGFLSSIGKSAGAFAVFAVAALAVKDFVDSLNDGQEIVQSFQDSVAGLTSAMVEAGSTDMSGAVQAAYEAAARGSESFKQLTAAGIDAGTAMRYLTDQGFTPTTQQADALGAAVSNMDLQTAMATSTFRDQAGAAQENAAELLAKKAADQAAAQSAAEAGQATAAQTQLLAEQAVSAAKAATEAASVAAEQTGVATAMRQAAAATDAASRAADAFGLAMDQLAGRNITAEQAALSLNNGMRSLSEAFAGAADKGGYSMDALAAWNVAALTSTQAGADLYGALNDVRGGYDATVTSAYQTAAANGDAAAGMAAARAAADTAYASFMTLATGAGLSGEQAVALAAKLGIVAGTDIPDKTFQLIAEDQAAQAAIQGAQQATIDAKTVEVDALISPAVGQFSLLTGQQLDNTVQVDANTGQATGQINQLTGQKYQTTVQAQADTNQAQSTLQGFTSAQRSTQVQVQADTGAAQSAITALVNQRRVLTILVEANVNPAQQAINGIQGKTVTVTVNTQQNVTQTVTTVPAPAAAMTPLGATAAAPGLSPIGLTAEAAPPPMRRLHAAPTESEGGGGTTYVINVDGGLDSADSIARRIEGVLRQRDRRNYGVTVGRVPR